MREWFRFHAPTVGAFLALVVVAGSLSLAMPVPRGFGESGSPLPVKPIALPAPGEDRDHDSYEDGVDLVDGDLQVGLRLVQIDVPRRDAEPYVLLGTQDDHYRTGAGAELEWRHVVDPDSLGRKAGSYAWQDSVLRTGQWYLSRPADGEPLAIAKENHLGVKGPSGAHWPQTLWANVRDDRPHVNLTVELRDASSSPHEVRGTWRIEADLQAGLLRVDDGSWQSVNQTLVLTQGTSTLRAEWRRTDGLSWDTMQAVAVRWAPTLRFDSQEEFVPVRGDLLEHYHGFTRGPPDLRTWDLEFNAGRDGYRLFLADFNGDRHIDHEDAVAMADVLTCGLEAANPCGPDDERAPTVYASVGPTVDDQLVVQFWFFYFYNFVLDDAGDDVAALQHKGDREFLQLTFPNLAAAQNGTPSAVAFSQHYEGLLVTDLAMDEAPFEDGRLVVHVARGSHAVYPAPGDDKRLRSSLTSLFDRFDGKGRELAPDDYTLQLLGDQPWHAGYNWGPVTRYTRDLGTSTRPFLQHDFRYPFTDPLWWQESLRTAQPDDFEAMYGKAP